MVNPRLIIGLQIYKLELEVAEFQQLVTYTLVMGCSLKMAITQPFFGNCLIGKALDTSFQLPNPHNFNNDHWYKSYRLKTAFPSHLYVINGLPCKTYKHFNFCLLSKLIYSKMYILGQRIILYKHIMNYILTK